MIRNLFKNPKLTNFFTILTLITLIPGCGIYKPVDARKVPVNVNDRVRKNIEEGRGIRFGKSVKGGVFDFASANELWRASVETLDFVPLRRSQGYLHRRYMRLLLSFSKYCQHH